MAPGILFPGSRKAGAHALNIYVFISTYCGYTVVILFQFDSLFLESHLDKLSRNMAVYTLSVTMHKQETN